MGLNQITGYKGLGQHSSNHYYNQLLLTDLDFYKRVKF